jgi:predicted membrane-bound spermidine synthase
MRFLLPASAFLSGCAALVFETLWFRVAGVAFGNGVWASSLVLAAFMAGLAAGNALAARLADRVAHPLRAYAAIEVVIGSSAAALVFAMPALTGMLAEAFAALGERPWLLNGVRLPLAFVLMMVPASAMGATLPVLVHALSAEDPRFGRALGRLYGWNTLGAVVGAVAGELWLFAPLGLPGSALAAAALNAAAAAGALGLAGATRGRLGAREPEPAPRRPRLSAAPLRLLAAAFLAGAAFLALEVVWFRFLSLFVDGTSAIFGVLLAVVLAGIGLGGLAGSRWLAAAPGRAARELPALALLAGCAALAGYAGWGAVVAAAFHDAPGRSAVSAVEGIAITAPLVLPLALLSGVLFPTLGDAARGGIGSAARTTGYLSLVNTLGATAGSLLAGFVLLPRLGIERSILLCAWAYVGIALLCWLRLPGGERRPRAAPALLLAAFAAGLVAFPRGALEGRYLLHALLPFQEADTSTVAVHEGRIHTIVYTRTDRFGEPLYHRLVTDGFSMSATGYFARRYMKAFVLLPVALHPDPRSALLISYGMGSTARALVDTDSLERIDVVDLSADVFEMNSVVYPDPADDPLRDPRVVTHVEDGRFFLQTARSRYDLVTAEPPPPKHAGVVNLYTREYFAAIRERLEPGGYVSYWLPVHQLTRRDTLAITRAFCDVFADCSLWSGAGLDWMLLGSRAASPPPSEEHFGRQWREPKLARELVALGFERPEHLAATWLAGPERLAALTRRVAPLVDAFPLRLSARPVPPEAIARSAFVAALMDTKAARADFAESALVAGWPEALREKTLAFEPWQRIVNDQLASTVSAAAESRIGDLHAVLTGTDLRALPLWLLGSSLDEQRIARALDPRLAGDPEVQEVLGIGALAERDYRAAVGHFRRARAGAALRPRAALLEVFALCLGGEVERAALLARRLVGEVPAAAGEDAHWRFLEATFGLPDPRRS